MVVLVEGFGTRNCNWRRIGGSNLELSSSSTRNRGARSNRLVIRKQRQRFPLQTQPEDVSNRMDASQSQQRPARSRCVLIANAALLSGSCSSLVRSKLHHGGQTTHDVYGLGGAFLSLFLPS